MAALGEGEGRQENDAEGGALANVEQLARHTRNEGECVMTSCCKRWKGEQRGRRRKTKREVRGRREGKASLLTDGRDL